MTPLDELFDAIVVLNLPSSTARRQSIQKEFTRLGVRRLQIVEGIDGKALDLKALRSSGILTSRDRTPGEVGCYLTHLKAYQEIVDRGLETALVCEDDIVFADDANELFSDYMERMPADWDIIHFWSSRPVGSASPCDRRQPVSAGIYRGFDEGGGAVCNALRRRCIQYLLGLAFPIKYAIDGITNWPTGPWTEGYNGYIVSPFPCRLAGFESEIDKRGRRWIASRKAKIARHISTLSASLFGSKH